MNFPELLQKLNVEFVREGEHHHARPGWIQLDCPFCGSGSRKFHMGYSMSGNFCNCWKCGGHSLVNVLVQITSKPVGECKKLLGGLEHVHTQERVHTGKLVVPKGVGELLPIHRKYLKERGFTDLDELQRLWKVQGIGLSARLSWRLFIPIHYKREVVSWTTRAVRKDVELRYISAGSEEEAVPHKSILYGADHVKHVAVLVEGPIDCWKIGPGAVATCGTGYSRAQLDKLSKYPVRAVCYDNEPIAQKRARDIVNMLSAFPGETYNIQLDAKDAGEASEKEIKKLRRAVGL